MRSDYGLYGVAIICLIIAVVFGAGAVQGYSPTEPIGITVIVIFLLLGIIAAVVGYSARPKAIMPTPQPIPAPETPPTPPPAVHVEEKVEEAPAAPPPAVEEVTAAPEPSPAPPTPVPEEPGKVEAIEEKPVRRRRRKKTA